MDEQTRRNENTAGNGRHASSENEREQRDDVSRQRERPADRSPLTKREREERWPIG